MKPAIRRNADLSSCSLTDLSKINTKLPRKPLGEPRVASISDMKDWRRGEKKQQKYEFRFKPDAEIGRFGIFEMASTRWIQSNVVNRPQHRDLDGSG